MCRRLRSRDRTSKLPAARRQRPAVSRQPSVRDFRALAPRGSRACNVCMKCTHFRDLQVWQRSMTLAQAVYAATRELPKEEMFGLTSQLRRSAVSIPSNIAEGQGRDSDKSFALFLTQAQGSLYELETQIELARNLRMMGAGPAKQLLTEASEIGRMIHGLLRALRKSPAPA